MFTFSSSADEMWFPLSDEESESYFLSDLREPLDGPLCISSQIWEDKNICLKWTLNTLSPQYTERNFRAEQHPVQFPPAAHQFVIEKSDLTVEESPVLCALNSELFLIISPQLTLREAVELFVWIWRRREEELKVLENSNYLRNFVNQIEPLKVGSGIYQ